MFRKMIPSRRARLTQTLIERRREIQDDIRSRIRAERANRPNDVQDAIEASDADVQGDLTLAVLQMRAQTLARIDEALARVGEGTYGNCAECTREIAPRRLRALPFAVRCQACEERREQEQGRRHHFAQGRLGFPLFRDVAGV